MYRFLCAIRQWQISIPAIVGGSWILYQFLHFERLRRQKEGPSLDGKLSATMIPCDNGRLLVTVEASWTNNSPLSIYLNLDESYIDLFRIDSTKVKEDGVVEFRRRDEPCFGADLGELVCSYRFLHGKGFKSYYRFEPNAKSTIMNHFVLQPGIYGIRKVLFGKKSRFGKKTPLKGFEKWPKELVTAVAVPDAQPRDSAAIEPSSRALTPSSSC